MDPSVCCGEHASAQPVAAILLARADEAIVSLAGAHHQVAGGLAAHECLKYFSIALNRSYHAHARACPAHPRLCRRQAVDGRTKPRTKPGLDEFNLVGKCSSSRRRRDRVI